MAKKIDYKQEFLEISLEISKLEGKMRRIRFRKAAKAVTASKNASFRMIYDEALREMRKPHRNLVKIDNILEALEDLLDL